MEKNSLVTVSFFRFKSVKDKWWAFGEMGKRSLNIKTDGLQFAKMLGTGGGNGFSIRPDFGRYGWLAVWDSEQEARTFFQENTFFQNYKNRSAEYFILFLRTSTAHGKWDGATPFSATEPFDIDAPVAVLTRATIKTSHLHRFWRFVPTVSRSMEGKAGLVFSLGVGELPLIQQATFSLWTSARDMLDYAYKSPHHAEVVKKTRELGWYSEELFARFRVVDTEGSDSFADFSLVDLKKQLKMV